jgi:hypothetical protein
MTAHLRPCPGCSRHVRVSEGACPFCSASLDASFQASPAPVGPSRRLARAAFFAFGTGTLVLAPALSVGCQAVYGGPPVPEDGGGAAIDAAKTSPAPPYGLAPQPPEDAG